MVSRYEEWTVYDPTYPPDEQLRLRVRGTRRRCEDEFIDYMDEWIDYADDDNRANRLQYAWVNAEMFGWEIARESIKLTRNA